MAINSLSHSRKLNVFRALIPSLRPCNNDSIARDRGSMIFKKSRNLAPLLLMASLSVLSACTSSSAADSSTDAGKAFGKTKGSTTGGGGGTITPTPTPVPSPSTSTITYDTSIGNGVDASGFADLPL